MGCCPSDRLSYFNLPISSEPSSPANPLAWLRALATADDYVVFKLDIDTPRIERQIVEQLLASPELAALVDDFFWEHTVTGGPKLTRRWPSGTSAPEETLQQSYGLFTRLRRAGIRAHAWV